MTVQEVKTLAESIGLSTAYYEFPSGTQQEPPFLCWFFPDGRGFNADDRNYQKVERCVFELYAPYKDFELEATVEAALNGADIAYQRDEAYIDSEKMYQTNYTFEVVITEANDNG
jgi:hypothetical protein